QAESLRVCQIPSVYQNCSLEQTAFAHPFPSSDFSAPAASSTHRADTARERKPRQKQVALTELLHMCMSPASTLQPPAADGTGSVMDAQTGGFAKASRQVLDR